MADYLKKDRSCRSTSKVVRPLIVVSTLAAGGHQVQFGKQHGETIHGVTGKKTRFGKKNGVCVCCVLGSPVSKPHASQCCAGH